MTSPRRAGGTRNFVITHLESPQVSRVIYGAIIGLALVVALEAHPPSAGAVVASLLATAVAIMLAELYSELVGFRTHWRRKADAAEMAHLRADVGAVGAGIASPAVFFLLAATGAFETDTAFTIAKWSGLGLIGVYGFAGARFSGSSLMGSLAKGVGVALIGGALIAFKALIH